MYQVKAISTFFTSLLVVLLLGSGFSLSAECPTVFTTFNNNGQYVLQVVNPQPGVNYTWNITPAFPAMPYPVPGPTVALNYVPGSLTGVILYVDHQICFQKRVHMYDNCDEGGFTTVIKKEDCNVEFTHNPPTYQHYNPRRFWDFGDGSPVLQTNANPVYHAYPFPGGTYTVTHWLEQSNETIILLYRCIKPVVVDCIPPVVITESLICCELTIHGEAGLPNCTHEWIIRNSLGNICYTFNTPTFDISPTNFSTDVNGSISITHTVTCGSLMLPPTTINHVFQHPGIYAGNPAVLLDQISLTNLTGGCMNHNQVVFPANVSAFSGNIYLQGTLQVDRNLTLAAADVCVTKCEGIDVLTGITLDLQKSTTVHEAPECEAWRGIDMRDSSNIISSNSTIRGALHGIRVNNPGVSLSLSDSRFVDNFIGVLVNTKCSSSIASCLFTSQQGLPPAPPCLFLADSKSMALSGGYFSGSRGFIGIMVNNVNDFRVAPAIQNRFVNLANGIWYENSTTPPTGNGVNNNFFNNILSAIPYNGDNSGHCIMLNHNAGNGRMNASFNTMNECTYGVRTISNASSTGASIMFNTITGAVFGVSVENPGGSYVPASRCNLNTITANNGEGVRVQLVTTNFYVQINTVNGYGGTIGIHIDNSPNTSVISNILTGNGTGIHVVNSTMCNIGGNILTNEADGLLFTGNCKTPGKISCNRFSGCTIGLHLEADAVTGEQYSRGNKWFDGNITGAKHDGDVTESPFTYMPDTPDDPITVDPPTGWFFPNGVPNQQCPNLIGEEVDDRTIDQTTNHYAINIAPNPNNGQFKVNIDNWNEADPAQIQVFDMTGKLIKMQPAQGASNTVDLSANASGWYIVSIKWRNSGQVQYEKCFVQQ